MRAPDIDGRGGKVWILSRPPGSPIDWQATIAAWLLHVPGAHPLWSYWQVAVIHLRDIPGVPPARRRYPEAEYEVMILSLDPDHPANPDPGPGERVHFLMPPDLVHQFHGLDDAGAEQLGTLVVRTIADGRMSPDSDYRAIWRTLIDGTVKHLREGAHRPS